MHYLLAPASTSSGSQQLRLCDQGMCKPDIAVNEVGLLADVGTWLEESTCATVSSSERVRAASARAALCTDMHFLDPLHVLLPLHLLISGPICFWANDSVGKNKGDSTRDTTMTWTEIVSPAVCGIWENLPRGGLNTVPSGAAVC